jgi:Ca2+:H+ antiporter
MKIMRLMKSSNLFLLFLVFIPASIYCYFFTSNQTLAFIFSAIAIIPLAWIIGYATKELALQTNPNVGGLINATFGNIVELIIAVFALSKGLLVVVKASLIGSIIGNLLLLIGLSVFFGGLKFKQQRFNRDSASASATMLIIAVTGLAIPTVYAMTANSDGAHVQALSDSVAIVLAVIYLAGIVFATYTHKHLFDSSDEIKASREKPTISWKKAAWILFIATAVVAFEAEILVKGVEGAALSLGMTQTFVGVIIIAIITNIAEKANAIHFAMQDKLDIAIEIGLSSAIQIALFVVPILIFISEIFGYGFSLVFSMFEIIAVMFAVMIVNYLSSDGRCNWLEGAQLLSVYLILAIAFFFL